MERKKRIFDENSNNLRDMLLEKIENWELKNQNKNEVKFQNIHKLFSKLDEIFRFKGSLSKKYVIFLL